MSPAPEPRTSTPLFRAEAVAEQESRWLGQVLIVPRLGQTLAVGLAGLLALSVLGLLAFGQYTRTERLSGWLAPATVTPGQGEAAPRLEARLYGPGEAIGDIRPGQEVRLRFDAFPHQQHSQHEGLVRRVLPAEMTPDEVTAITGDPALSGSRPLFRVDVELARQSLGERTQLLPTMTVEADILIETRRVWEWVLNLGDALAGPDPGGGRA